MYLKYVIIIGVTVINIHHIHFQIDLYFFTYCIYIRQISSRELSHNTHWTKLNGSTCVHSLTIKNTYTPNNQTYYVHTIPHYYILNLPTFYTTSTIFLNKSPPRQHYFRTVQ